MCLCWPYDQTFISNEIYCTAILIVALPSDKVCDMLNISQLKFVTSSMYLSSPMLSHERHVTIRRVVICALLPPPPPHPKPCRFYPYHYAPFVSDIKDIATLHIEFELGTPFLPYQQLLSVLPPASKSLLPRAYQGLMLNEDSVLKSFYPVEFATDLNGKQQEWEAVVLIPFIDEVGRREGEGGEAGMGDCGVDPFH